MATKDCEACGHSAGRHNRSEEPSPCMADHCSCDEYEHVREGEAYTVEYIPGDFEIRVEALSGVWENSEGIRAFDARLLDPLGKKDVGDEHTVRMHLFEVV